MKRTFIIALLLSQIGCKSTQVTQAWVAKHCVETHSISATDFSAAVHVHCDSLYNPATVKDVCPVATVAFDASEASLDADLQCNDNKKGYIANLVKLVKKYLVK